MKTDEQYREELEAWLKTKPSTPLEDPKLEEDAFNKFVEACKAYAEFIDRKRYRDQFKVMNSKKVSWIFKFEPEWWGGS